jgi:hypothetical protein
VYKRQEQVRLKARHLACAQFGTRQSGIKKATW